MTRNKPIEPRLRAQCGATSLPIGSAPPSHSGKKGSVYSKDGPPDKHTDVATIVHGVRPPRDPTARTIEAVTSAQGVRPPRQRRRAAARSLSFNGPWGVTLAASCGAAGRGGLAGTRRPPPWARGP